MNGIFDYLETFFHHPMRSEGTMSKAQFKPGQVVLVISGGPPMTVTKCAEDASGEMTVWCSWFDGKNPMDGTFPAAAVKIYKGD
jgi:uncharacterized protein YodC (DUF2158 family)